MQHQTHYAALFLTSNATTPVIKAAYKALALIYHPDKTVDLSAPERADHAAKFQAIQEAYDVLASPTLRKLYDKELEYHKHKVDTQRSTFHHATSARNRTTPFRRHVHTTTPAEKEAMKAKAEQQIKQIKEERSKRAQEDLTMDVAGLKHTLKIWNDMAADYEGDPEIRAMCHVKVYEYRQKILAREKEQKEWLETMSSPKSPPRASRTRPPQTASKAEQRKHAEKQRADKLARLTQERMQEKARRDAAKKGQQDAKAAAVRAEKEKLKQKANEAAAKEAERISRARAKAAPKNEPDTGASDCSNSNSDSTSEKVAKATASKSTIKNTCIKKTCGNCSEAHATLAEWKRCAVVKKKTKSDDLSFFNVV